MTWAQFDRHPSGPLTQKARCIGGAKGHTVRMFRETKTSRRVRGLIRHTGFTGFTGLSGDRTRCRCTNQSTNRSCFIKKQPKRSKVSGQQTNKTTLDLIFCTLYPRNHQCVGGYQRSQPQQPPTRPAPPGTADLRRACWSGGRRAAFTGSPGIRTGISSGLVIVNECCCGLWRLGGTGGAAGRPAGRRGQGGAVCIAGQPLGKRHI